MAFGGQLYAGVGSIPAVYWYNTATSAWVSASSPLAVSGDVLSLSSYTDGALYAGVSAGGGVFKSLGGSNWVSTGTPGGTNGSPDITALVPFSYQVKEDTWNTLTSLFAGRRAGTS